MLSVSTTLSASEFTENAGITHSATNTKQSFRHRLLAPRVVVLDPAATLDTPQWLLVSTGIRSVDHAVEGYCNPQACLATEALSLQGLRLLARALPAIKASPADLGSRLEAQLGMWQAIAPCAAGIATGASHGIGYALGATFGVPHGHTSCVDAARGAGLERRRQRRAAGSARGGDGRAGPAASELVKELIAGPRPAGEPAGRRHQAREPSRDRAPRAGIPPRKGQPPPHPHRRGRDGDPRIGVVSVGIGGYQTARV